MERSSRSRVVAALRSVHAIAVENPALPGTPDVNYVEGWIELKWAAKWPPRGGPLRLPHFTSEQRVWHLQRRNAGGVSWVLLQVGDEWLLFDAVDAAMGLGYIDEGHAKEIAVALSFGFPKELLSWISRPQKDYSLTADDVKRLLARRAADSGSRDIAIDNSTYD